MPDIILPDVLNYRLIGDPRSKIAALDTIPSVNYSKLHLVQPYLDELRRRSSARTATNQDSIYTRQDIDLFQNAGRQTPRSMNANV